MTAAPVDRTDLYRCRPHRPPVCSAGGRQRAGAEGVGRILQGCYRGGRRRPPGPPPGPGGAPLRGHDGAGYQQARRGGARLAPLGVHGESTLSVLESTLSVPESVPESILSVPESVPESTLSVPESTLSVPEFTCRRPGRKPRRVRKTLEGQPESDQRQP